MAGPRGVGRCEQQDLSSRLSPVLRTAKRKNADAGSCFVDGEPGAFCDRLSIRFNIPHHDAHHPL
jgi:hypothetical protein